MELIGKVGRALALGFRPLQLVNRALFELGSRLRIRRCPYQPVWLHLYVSSRCNFRCRFCTNHAIEDKGKIDVGFHSPVGDMTLHMFRDILRKYDRAMVCTFCGVGEPFLNRDLFKMIGLARARRMVTEVITNGSLLTRDTIKGILDSGLDRLTISLLEADATAHQEVIAVKRPFFKRIVESIVELRAAKNSRGRGRPSIKISRVLTLSTRERAYDFIELGLRLGVDEVLLNNLIFAEVGQYEMKECLFDTAENRLFFEDLRERYLGRSIKLELPVLLKENKRAGCEWYWKNMSIDGEGNVSGCGRFITPKAFYGSVRGPDPWNGYHFTRMRQRFNDLDILECCRNCIETSK